VELRRRQRDGASPPWRDAPWAGLERQLIQS